ncbi:MAG TPA: class I SAM-dependent methyltransferase [Rhodospirillales bacterium]|nr:class I SAM-dependent methyltransferase [Rhodospirillales bacterium]
MTLREQNIRPADLLAEYLRLNTEDGQNLLSKAGKMQNRPCPGCGIDDATLDFVKNGFTLVRCNGCDSLYVNPVPPEEAMATFYRDSPSADYWANVFFPAVAEARREPIYKPRAARINRIVKDNDIVPKQIIDVGAGAGLFLEEFSRLNPEVRIRAVEPGAAHAAGLRDKGFDIFEGYSDAAILQSDWKASADVVTCFEVLEHVSDPVSLFSDLCGLVRPGGLIVVSGLSGSGFDIQVLGKQSKPVSPPHHLTFLSIAGTQVMIERCGLELLSITTPGELDVDIVRNAALEDAECVGDPAIRRLILEVDDEERQAFQEMLKNSCRSSHMWIVSRRPEEGAAKN